MTSGSWFLTAAIRAAGTLTPTDQPTGSSITLTDSADQSLTYGTSSGNADIIVWRTKPLTAGATATYDLYTGTDLKDLFDATAAFRKIKSVAIWVDSGGDTSGVTIGNAASNANALFFGAQAHTATIYPSGPAFLGGSPAGVTVDATHKNLKVLNNGAVSVVVGIAIAGTSV